jgi:prepilin-type N-terminal cleavage/methylation domain-containing protein
MMLYSRNIHRGFTLAETVVVIAIVSVVSLAVMNLITFFYKSNAYVFQQTAALDSAHRGIAQSFRNIREASYGDDGSYPIAVAATSSITFYADVDNDGPIERVRVYKQGGTLYRGITKSAGNPSSYAGQTEKISTIATTVVNATSTPIFRYFTATGTELTSPINVSNIASISTELSVDLNPTRAPDIFTLRASATLRNQH